MERVNILISAYNGQTYICEQMDSLVAQTYKNIHIYVRNDGSTDATKQVLGKYEKFDNITIINGDNIGYGRSFLWLLRYADEGDYWAFCDQDDVWMPDKVERAVECLQKMPANEINMYVHDYEITDEDLKPSGKRTPGIKNYSFQMALTECRHMGFATVFNSAMRKKMLLGNTEILPSHDWWAELVAMEFGNIFEDEYVGAFHRRIVESISSTKLQSRVKWFVGALKGKSEIPILASQFLVTFENEIKTEHRKVLHNFDVERYHLGKALKKAFYPKRWRSSLASEIVVRCLMLIGRI